MTAILLVLNALVAVGLIILIMLQRNDPGTGGAFGGGSGGAQPVVRNPLAKPTAILAGIFLVSSLVIAYLAQGTGHGGSVVEGHEGEMMAVTPVTETAPVETSATVPALPAPELPAPASEVSKTQ